MRRFLKISFNGANYHGWQRQPHVPSIQQTLEENLSKILREPITCIGCGRTDAGVHALEYFLHFNYPSALQEDFLHRINRMLPVDMRVEECVEVQDLHAQHSATSRTYIYKMHRLPNAFIHQLSLHVDGVLDIPAMKSATSLMIGTQDFKSFCKRPDSYPHTSCEITEAKLTESGPTLEFEITGNRFLHHMVRLIIGNLLELGRERLTIEAFEDHLVNQTPFKFFNMAPAHGLYLSKVNYPSGQLDA